MATPSNPHGTPGYPDVVFKQDVGYGKIRMPTPAEVKHPRRLPLNGMGIFGVITATSLYGLWQVKKENDERRYWKHLEHQSKLHIMPILQAEEDRRYLRNQIQIESYEQILQEAIPGYKPVFSDELKQTQWFA